MFHIVGKRGLLARAFARVLAKKGIPFTVSGKEDLDILDRGAVASYLGKLHPAYVINCSGYTAVDKAEDEVQAAFALNRDAVENLQGPWKLIHFSSDYVFDGAKDRFCEEDPVGPLSVYGKSKLSGEPFADLVIRVSWLFGPDGPDFFSTMKRLLMERKELSVVSDQVGRPTYVDDIVEATLGLKDEVGIFHFANEGETSWFSITNWLKEKLDATCEVKPISTKEYGAKALRPLRSVLDTSKYENLLGSKPVFWQNRVL